MRPVRIMHGREVHIVLVAHQRRHHHMRAIQRMHLFLTFFLRLYEIRRERRALLPRQHGQHVATLDFSLLAYLLTFTCTSCIAVAI